MSCPFRRHTWNPARAAGSTWQRYSQCLSSAGSRHWQCCRWHPNHRGTTLWRCGWWSAPSVGGFRDVRWRCLRQSESSQPLQTRRKGRIWRKKTSMTVLLKSVESFQLDIRRDWLTFLICYKHHLYIVSARCLSIEQVVTWSSLVPDQVVWTILSKISLHKLFNQSASSNQHMPTLLNPNRIGKVHYRTPIIRLYYSREWQQ